MEIIIISLGVLIDRICKIWAVRTMQNSDNIHIIKGFFDITYTENTGAAFSILRDNVNLLIVLTSFVVLGMIYFLYKSRRADSLFKISLALLISGAIGNLVDRMAYGYVVDFFMLHYKDAYYFPIFNVADICVVIGAFLLSVCIIKDVE